jgi:hypothetical protein
MLNAAARSITASSLNQHLAVPQSGDELQALAETLNGMLVRIEEAFRRMTRFTANASHELRTPLAQHDVIALPRREVIVQPTFRWRRSGPNQPLSAVVFHLL